MKKLYVLPFLFLLIACGKTNEEVRSYYLYVQQSISHVEENSAHHITSGVYSYKKLDGCLSDLKKITQAATIIDDAANFIAFCRPS